MLRCCLALWCCLAAGCNEIYGLDKTKVRDASFFDVREDFECPAFGDTPKFSTTFTKIENCEHYSEAADIGRAIARCGRISLAPIDGSFSAIAAFDARFDIPRFAPEGDEVFVYEGGSAMRVYRREIDDTFTLSHTVTYPSPVTDIRYGTPTRGPNRRMLIGRYPESGFVDEIEIPPSGIATIALTHTKEDLGVSNILAAPNMTPDGLHMVFPGRIDNATSYMLYADRKGLGDKFSRARIIENIPFVPFHAPFLNHDCSRLYTVTDMVPNSTIWSQRQ